MLWTRQARVGDSRLAAFGSVPAGLVPGNMSGAYYVPFNTAVTSLQANGVVGVVTVTGWTAPGFLEIRPYGPERGASTIDYGGSSLVAVSAGFISAFNANGINIWVAAPTCIALDAFAYTRPCPCS